MQLFRRRLGRLCAQLTAAGDDGAFEYFRVSRPAPGWVAIVEGLNVLAAVDPVAGVGIRAALRNALLAVLVSLRILSLPLQ